ncbi:MAG: glycoside hydrolase family 98 domain-containing protein [Oscillospiraceae bacterium]
MIKGTRFFSKRLLPLLLAAVMLLGMLPALTLPVLAEEPPALTNVAQGKNVSIHGPTSGADRPASWLTDGITESGKYVEISKDTEQNSTDPSYAQIDLGTSYDITKVEFWNYWDDGRTLVGLVILASEKGTFAEDDRTVIFNSDTENFFGFGVGTDASYKSVSAGLSVEKEARGRYVRVMNNGHDGGTPGQKKHGGHYMEIKVYGTEHTGGAPETTLYNVAAGCNVIVNKWGDGSDRPNSWLTDGIKDNAKYIEVCKDKAQNTSDPSYAQIDLGNEYPVSKVNFWNYWQDNRTLNSLHILLSTTADFQTENTKEIYSGNWQPAKEGLTVLVQDAPFEARYVRIWNDGHDKGKGGHYIEVEVLSTEDKKAPLPAEYKNRDVLQIPTYSYTAQGGQAQKAEWDATHPDVIDFTKTNKAGGKWGGYRYWMALTPNQDGYSQYENPCLAASHDGINWVVPNGIENPLSNVEHEPTGTHNCDTDLVYNPDSDELWVYYVWERDQPAGTPSNLRLIRVKEKNNSFEITSTTGGNPYESLINSQYRYDMQSPAIVRRGADNWLMWSNNSDSDNSGNGWQSQVAFVELRTSTDGKNWTNKQSLADTLVLKGTDGIDSYIPWHLDVQWVEGQGEYWGLFCAYPRGGNTTRTYLLFATSKDGKTWTTYPKPLISPRDNKWDNNFIYRSTFVYDDASGTLQVWYSGGKSGGWRIAYTEFENFLTDTLPTLGAPYTPGTPTPPPAGEDGWVPVPASDDTNIHFDGAWTYEAPNRFADAEGSTATLYFYGSGIRYYAQYETNFGEVEVQIDDGTPETYDLHRDTAGAMDNKILEKELEADYHRITIKRKHGGGLDSGVIDLNKFEVRYDTSATISNHLYGVSPTEKTLWVDDTLQISALVPFNATDKTVTYTSSDTGKATVTATGLVTALTAGDVTITVKAGQSEKTVSLTIRSLEAGALRMTVDKDNPLFLHGLYKYDGTGYPANGLAGPLQGGKSIQGFWTALTGTDKTGWQGPTVQAGNKTIHHAILIHASGTVEGSAANKQWYLDRIAETKNDNIPFFLMVSNSHTGTFLDLDWLDGIYEQNENMMGVVFSENHNAGISERDRRITYMDALVKQAAKWGGYVINCDMNDAPKDSGGSDYGGTLEYFLNNETLYQTLKKYSQNYILLAKTTSAWSNVSYNSHESVALGAWLDGLCGNWGSLIDSWMWFIEGYGPQWGANTFSVQGGPEECRGPVSMPELLFAMRMVQQARTGATVFTFEHPDHAEAVGDNEGAKTYFTPNYKYSIAKAMEYMRDYAIPTREQVMQNTKVFYASSGGTLNKLGSNAANRLLDPLYGDSGSSGPNKGKNNGTTMMTYSTGRYGTIPSLPKMAQDPTGKDILRMADVQALGGAAGIQNYFNARYPQRYNGTGYAHYDELTKSWLTYNSNWFFDTRENSALHSKQNVSFQFTQNSFGANIEFEPYSMFLVDEAQAGTLQFRFNNYWVDKNPIWEGYVKGTTPTWDSDNNRLMYNYLKDSYAQNTAHSENTWRKATITISGLGAEPTLALTSSLAGQSKQIQTAFDAAAGTYTITLDGNGYQEFTLTNLVPAQAPAENWVSVPSRVNGNQLSPHIQFEEGWVVDKLNQEDPSSYTKGAQASLVFYGTGVRYFAQKDTNFGTAIVRLYRHNPSGEPILVETSEVDLNGAAAPAAKVYEKTGLTPDVYLISVEPKEGWNNADKNVIDLQKFEVNQTAIETVPTRVWSVEADPASITVGGTSTLKTRLNFNAADTAVSYAASPDGKVTIDGSTVTGAARGTVTITATAAGSSKTTTLTVTGGTAGNWVYVDSHSGQIQYTGNWVDETSTNHYEGSAKEANDAPGATASLTFTGTGFRWIGQMDSNYGRAWIYVDDVLVAIGNANSSTNPYQFTILELHGLENKQHTVRLEAESNAPVQVDAFAYYTGTDLDETVSSVALEPSGLIRLGDGESKPVLAMAMNAERVVVFRDDFRFTLENDTIAGLSGDGKTQKTVTGKMAGRTRLHVTLPELNDKSATAEIVVTSTEPATTPRMLVDAEHPLLLVSLYANTKHPAWWDNSGIPGVPMQGHNTMEGVWRLIPEDLKPYTAIQLHADDYLGHAWGGIGNKENLQKFYEYHVAIAQEKGINLYLTLMTGGVPINTFRNLIDMDWLNDLIDNNSCIKGVVFAENHHNGDTGAVAQLTAEYLELFSSKGIYLVLTDIDDANHRMEKWFENDTLFKTAQKHHKYLVINSKSTSSSGYNTVRSFALGTWLSGLADNWGALTDAWAWYEIRYHKLFEPVMNTTYEDVRRVYTFPETLFAMNMLQSYVNGGTVFNAEHPFYCTGVYDEASWVLKESIIPTMRYMIANPAATREQVKDEIKAVYHTDSYLPTNFAEGLYGTAQDNNLLQTSGRYRTLPVLSSKLSDAEASAFGRVLKSADLADKINILNAQYPELSTGDAFVETLLGGGAGQTGRRLLIMNSLFNENKNQSATLTPTDAKFATSMGFTLTPHTYLIAHETADSIKIDLNNFRTDKDELWVPGESENPDWTSFGNDWNGDHKDYVQDYMKYHISNPKLDKDRDLRSTVITLHTEERPTAVVTRNGGSTKLADDNFYTETYENGVYTLTITHNGQVNVTIRKGSAEPTPTVTEFKLVTDPEALTSAGGKAMLTLTGTNLPDGTKFYWGTDQAMLTPVDAEGSDASRSVEVKLPENTGTDAVTYYFRYSLDGTTLAGELTATVPGTGGGTQPTEPSVTDYSVAPTELPSNGGMIMVTLTGTNLQNGIQIKAGTITAQTSGDAAKQTETLTLPANYSSSSVSYTVQYSLNGVDWVGGKTVRVSGRYTPPVSPGTPSVPTKPGVPERDPFPFTDVSRSSWYYDSVRTAWEKDLIDGVTRTLYKPDDTLTVAQAIKLSAALHQMLNNNGKVTLRNGTPYWYSSYVSYAVENGIIEKMYLDYTPAQMNAPAKRNEFVHIFYGAMSDYRQINTVADNKIPDVITTDTYALEIYTFYRAGILTGSDKNGTFYPTNDIKRSEVAAILSRMYDKTARKTVSLP